MLCDTPHGPQFVLGAIGVLPAPIVSDITFAASALAPREVDVATSFAPFPDGPPPKLL